MTRDEAIKGYVIPALKRTWTEKIVDKVLEVLDYEKSDIKKWLKNCAKENGVEIEKGKEIKQEKYTIGVSFEDNEETYNTVKNMMEACGGKIIEDTKIPMLRYEYSKHDFVDVSKKLFKIEFDKE